MVLRLKTRESRSLPGLQNATQSSQKQSKTRNQYGTPSKPTLFVCRTSLTRDNCFAIARQRQKPRYFAERQKPDGAGWSSPVARQAHNLKAAGSNPAPATKNFQHYRHKPLNGDFGVSGPRKLQRRDCSLANLAYPSGECRKAYHLGSFAIMRSISS